MINNSIKSIYLMFFSESGELIYGNKQKSFNVKTIMMWGREAYDYSLKEFVQAQLGLNK